MSNCPAFATHNVWRLMLTHLLCAVGNATLLSQNSSQTCVPQPVTAPVPAPAEALPPSGSAGESLRPLALCSLLMLCL